MNNSKPTEQDRIDSRRKFVSEFNATMVKIWTERITLLKVFDTGGLYHSVGTLTLPHTPKMNSDVSDFTLTEEFSTHGLWQNYGVGRETPRGNPGDIGRPKVRKKKPWFDRKYFGSVLNLRDFMADSFCQQYMAMFSNAFSDRTLRAQATL